MSLDVVLRALTDVLQARREEPITVRPGTSLSELGLDSLDFAELIVAVEEITGVELDPDSVVDLETVQDLTRLHPVADLGAT